MPKVNGPFEDVFLLIYLGFIFCRKLSQFYRCWDENESSLRLSYSNKDIFFIQLRKQTTIRAIGWKIEIVLFKNLI